MYELGGMVLIIGCVVIISMSKPDQPQKVEQSPIWKTVLACLVAVGTGFVFFINSIELYYTAVHTKVTPI